MKAAKGQLRFAGMARPRKHGGGRPPNGDRAGVSHLRREALSRHHAVHVTLRTVASVPGMRRQRAMRLIEEAFRSARVRFGMRIVHYSVQGNHLHLLVEADDKASLARGMQGLAIRVAKALNRISARSGQVWADRYHAHVLRSRREAANALRYVLGNLARHARRTATAARRSAFSAAPIATLRSPRLGRGSFASAGGTTRDETPPARAPPPD